MALRPAPVRLILVGAVLVSALAGMVSCVTDDSVGSSGRPSSGSSTSSTSSTSGASGDTSNGSSSGNTSNGGSSGSVDAGGCNLDAAFGAPVEITQLGTGQSQRARLSPDQLEMFVTQWADPASELRPILRYERPKTSALWNPSSPQPTLPPASMGPSSPRSSNSITFVDAVNAYVAVEASGVFGLRKALVTNGVWTLGDVVTVTGLESGAIVDTPWLNRDGTRLYAHTTGFTAPPPREIGVATRTTDGVLGPLVPLDIEPASPQIQSYLSPVLSEDEKTMYFGGVLFGAQPRTGPKAPVSIYVTTRTDVSAAFGAPVALAKTLNSMDSIANEPSWLSPDGCELFFTRTTEAPVSPPVLKYTVLRARKPN
jgi:hypothetical protein